MRRKLRKFDHKTDHKIDYADHQHKASNDAACMGKTTGKSAQNETQQPRKTKPIRDDRFLRQN
ncbi:TPA: hypothetical protein PPG70_003565 [Escherichia coli]|uniref:hypothetical protein n=1 Tax=Escherichia coli TaxID=562 RepID=UPI000FAC9AC7|nr:hypothetical protein [Escherichia coli]HAU9697546.1 hypothetical protein [Escherichia coli]HDI9608164.1 hypothetical protein [Escherichia coli]